MLQTATVGKDIVLVDLRRTDHEVSVIGELFFSCWLADLPYDCLLQGGTIRGSINLPAQTLYHSIPTLYALFTSAGVKTVIWYCGTWQSLSL